MKIKQLFYINCFILLFSYTIKSQINAAFVADTTQGCSPFIVQFTNQSTGSITSQLWLFGNGNSSTEINPQAAYVTPGKYTVTLIVYNGTTSDTLTRENYITVFANPQANFSTTPSPIGCIPLTLVFQDKSIEGDTTITEWIWDFGNGNTSTFQNPNYTYNLLGNYSISLQVTDANGCENTKFVPNYVKVADIPDPDFSVDVTKGCTIPFTTVFTNSTTGNGTINYKWYFGDSTTSTVAIPEHNYTNFGTYSVKLVATNTAGCTDSITRNNLITISKITTSFTTSEDTTCVGDTVFFENFSSGGGAQSSWNFGDGSSSNGYHQSHIYKNPGTYFVSLKFTLTAECADTLTDTIFVENISANFSIDTSYGCELPFKVEYYDLSTNASSWHWKFGDGDSSTSQNPIKWYNNSGTFSDTLIASSAYGCSDTFFIPNNVSIILPNAKYIPNAVSYSNLLKGCAPLLVNFHDVSTSIEPITSWEWDFGDSTTSSDTNPTHTFITDGVFTVNLAITNSIGCQDTFTYFVRTGTKPIVDFKLISNDTACAYDFTQFKDMSTDSTENNEWFWYFGDGGLGNQRNPIYQYGDTGLFPVTLIVGYNSCYDTLTKDSFIYIKGPVAKFNFDYDCNNPYEITFINKSIDFQYCDWDFGDGTILDSSTSDTVYHTYLARGTFPIQLTAYNDSIGCYYITTSNIIIKDIKANFIVNDTLPCLNDKVIFNAEDSHDASSYYWRYEGNIDTILGKNKPYNYTDTVLFNNSGTYKINLTVYDDRNNPKCSDSITKYIKVFKPIANFFTDTIFGCSPKTIFFSDSSISDTTIVEWFWDFGNDSTSTTQNTSYNYLENGTYSPTLIITDILGCKDTITKINTIEIIKTSARFFCNTNRNICIGDSVLLTNRCISENPFYIWDFGDGLTSNARDIWHVYNDSGSFDITLTVTDTINGCDSTITLYDYIHVQSTPIVNFVADKTYKECFPLFVNFTDSTIHDTISEWQWNFGDSTFSTNQNPGHNFTFSGKFDISLTATSSFGCKDSLTKTEYIFVDGPSAGIGIPDTTCIYDPVEFYLENLHNVGSFKWDFGDGNVYESNNLLDPVIHKYNIQGRVIPYLICYSDTARTTCPSISYDSLFIYNIVSDFNISDTIGCSPYFPFDFTDASVSNDDNLNWSWDFDNGFHSNTQNPINIIFSDTGIFHTKQVVSNEFGCKDSTTKTLRMYPLPIISISVADPSICLGSSTQVTVSGGTTYSWTPINDLSCTNCANPIASPKEDISYTVRVIDKYCPFDTIVFIDIESNCSVDVPNAFTPNDDGQNDIIYVDGFGIKKLYEYKIYNRWGQLMFETTDINEGWDGHYEGKDQNIDTYVYIVKAEMNGGEIVTRKGYIHLLR